MYLHENPGQFEFVVTAVANACGKPVPFVAKDYYVTLVLRETLARDSQLVFKGGTSLSKCYGIIKRFSEDIDLGIEEDHASEGQRKRIKLAVKTAVESLGLSIANLDQTRSKREFNRYEIPLPAVCAGSAVDGTLYVETAVMTPIAPNTKKQVASLVYDYLVSQGRIDLIEEYSLHPFTVRVTTLERAFCDKVYALCDYYLKGRDLHKPSRHLYDLHRLIEAVDLDDSLAQLMRKVGEERRQSSLDCPSAQEGISLHEVLERILRKEAYRRGYEETTLRLLDAGEDVDYSAATSSASVVVSFLADKSL